MSMEGISAIISGAAEMNWLQEAACREMDVADFFVEAGRTIKPESLEVCRGCAVRLDCLRHAYDRNLTAGYFGGTSPGQRRSKTLSESEAFIAVDKPRRRRS
jgi:WhiB family transcriptional regulator, redox-sensing transcriptional regulator